MTSIQSGLNLNKHLIGHVNNYMEHHGSQDLTFWSPHPFFRSFINNKIITVDSFGSLSVQEPVKLADDLKQRKQKS